MMNEFYTPSLIIDLNVLEKNVSIMAEFAKAGKMQLRPHCKGHKSTHIAKLQMKAGAIGISAATLGEAEVMVTGGISSVLITSPIVTSLKLERLIALHQRAEEVMIVVDQIENIEALAQRNQGGKRLKVLIDFDIGQNRTGAKSLDEALKLAEVITKQASLQLVGFQAYGGHLQHIPSYDERKKRIQEQNSRIRQLKEQLKGFCPSMIVTGGGTGTFDIDLHENAYTEIQPGSYVFMDVQYSEVELCRGASTPFEPSLFVLASVISAFPEFAVVDAGLKAFATDGPLPRLITTLEEAATYSFMGDEHGKISCAGRKNVFKLGTQLAFLTPHCDPTVNLYDSYQCIRGERCVAVWPVDARGLH